MRKVGGNLSAPCLVALVQAGEIKQADVERHNAAKAGKKDATGSSIQAADDPKDVSRRTIANGKAASAAGSAATRKSAKAPKKSKKATANSKPKPGAKAKTKKKVSAAAHPGSASKNGAAKKSKKTVNKKTVSKLSSAKPGRAKPAAVKKAKKVPVAPPS